MGDWNVDVDHDKNRLFIDLGGHMAVEEAEESTEEVIAGAEALDPGFDIVTNLEGFMPGDQEAVEYIEEGKRAMREHGASAAVRVMPDSATAQMHFERVGEDEEGYPVAVANSVEQAEKLLDQRREEQTP